MVGPACQREKEKKNRERERARVRDAAGLLRAARSWAGPGGLARLRPVSLFFCQNLSLFLFSVLKTENKNIAKLFIKICKNTF